MIGNLRWLCVIVIGLVLLQSASACIWDRDTLLAESRGLPNLPLIIVGRFERNPLAYYEMRLQRVTGELKGNPARLDLYDDAGVACDRLGQSDEAIAWMNRKKQQLDQLSGPNTDETKEHFIGTLRISGRFMLTVGCETETLQKRT